MFLLLNGSQHTPEAHPHFPDESESWNVWMFWEDTGEFQLLQFLLFLYLWKEETHSPSFGETAQTGRIRQCPVFQVLVQRDPILRIQTSSLSRFHICYFTFFLAIISIMRHTPSFHGHYGHLQCGLSLNHPTHAYFYLRAVKSIPSCFIQSCKSVSFTFTLLI